MAAEGARRPAHRGVRRRRNRREVALGVMLTWRVMTSAAAASNKRSDVSIASSSGLYRRVAISEKLAARRREPATSWSAAHKDMGVI